MRGLFIIALVLVLVCVVPAQAQANDETYTYLTVGRDTNDYPIPANQMKADFFISWQQLAYIVNTGKTEGAAYREDIFYSSNAFDNAIRNVMDRNDVFEPYIQERFSVSQESKPCPITFSPLPDQDRQGILLGKGIHISGYVKCQETISVFSVSNTLLTEVSDYQQNYVVVVKEGKEHARQRFLKGTRPVEFRTETPVKEDAISASESAGRKEMYQRNKIVNGVAISLAILGIVLGVFSYRAFYSIEATI